MKSKQWNKLSSSPIVNRKIDLTLGKNLTKEEYDYRLRKVIKLGVKYNVELSNLRKKNKCFTLKNKIKRTLEKDNTLNGKDFFNIQFIPNLNMFNTNSSQVNPTGSTNISGGNK